MSKAVTINDVALRAGVSVSTASKALCGKGRMGDDTRTRIIEVAKAMGYKPNRAAQSLSRKTVNIIALLPDYPSEVQDLICEGLLDAFVEYSSFNINYRIIRFTEAGGAEEVKKILKDLSGQIDAMVLMCDLADEEIPEIANQYHAGIPIVTLVANAEPYHAVTSVLIDAETVGRLAAQFMAICGAKETVMVAGRKGTYIHERNIVGYLEAAEQFHVPVSDIYYTNDDWKTAYAHTETAIREHPNIDGIFVSSYLAPSVCDCLRAHGLSGKIKVIGVDLYDKIEACLQDRSMLATIYQNQYLQARTAVDIIMDCISTGVRMLPPMRIKPEFVMLSNLKSYHIGKP